MTVMALMRSLISDRRGIAATEFALVAPFMIAAWLGSIEVCNLTRAKLKAQSAAYTVADLTAQIGEQTTASLGSIVAAAQHVLTPLPNALGPLSVTIASVGYNAQSGAPELLWKYTAGNAAPTIDLTIATGLGVPGGSVVVTRLSYHYESAIKVVSGPMTFTEAAVSRPRTVHQITLNGQVKSP